MHSLETEAGLNTSVFVNLRLFLFDFHTCQLSFSISVCTHTRVGLCTPTPTDTPHTRPAHPRLGAGQREDRAAVWVLLRCTWAPPPGSLCPQSALAEARTVGVWELPCEVQAENTSSLGFPSHCWVYRAPLLCLLWLVLALQAGQQHFGTSGSHLYGIGAGDKGP